MTSPATPAVQLPAGRAPSPDRRGQIASALLLATVLATGGALAIWKRASLREAAASAAQQPEPMEAVTVAVAASRGHQPVTTSIGTVLALRSVTLRNEVAGTVRELALTPGAIVEAGDRLVVLDVTVEEAELRARQAEAALAETMLGRMQRASASHGASEQDVDRARAQHDVALAEVERIEALIAKKTLLAPFRARVGLSDVHPGQYLNEGTELTTLQGVDEAVHVDFAVPQVVASALRVGESVEVSATGAETLLPATVAAIDARVDANTRNALVRVRVEDSAARLTPGASVRVRVPVGPPVQAVSVPVSALRKGPSGDHVFVLEPDGESRLRAHSRNVVSGAVLGDEVLILEGLAAGERVAASGSFKLHESVLVVPADDPGATAAIEQ